jgi:hypothetical protein
MRITGLGARPGLERLPHKYGYGSGFQGLERIPLAKIAKNAKNAKEEGEHNLFRILFQPWRPCALAREFS